MNKLYEVIKLENQKYDYLIIANPVNSALQYTTEIMNEINVNNADEFKANVLFDMLLINGTSFNRLISCKITKNRNLFGEFKLAENVSDDILQISRNYFEKNTNLVDKATIPNSLKALVKKGSI